MAIKIICGYNDPEFNIYENYLDQHFDPDDWDYMIMGENEFEVTELAEKLYVFEYGIKKVGNIFIAVTYHS